MVFCMTLALGRTGNIKLSWSLQWVLLRAKKSFPHSIGYQNFINDLTKLVSSQTLAHV